MKMKLTAAKRKALTNARDFGSAWNYRAPQVGGHSLPWRVSTDRMHKALFVEGLLSLDGRITEAGLSAVEVKKA